MSKNAARRSTETRGRGPGRNEALAEELERRKHIMTSKEQTARVKQTKSTTERLGGKDRSKLEKAQNDAKQATGETLTEKQVQSLKASFKKYDTDKDGKLNQDEFRNACRKLGILLTREELEEMLQEADSNGCIGYPVFEILVGHQLLISNFKNKQLKEAFGKFDIDGDGFITGEEIKAFFTSGGLEMTEADIDELIAEADANGDGVISFEEFVQSVCEKEW